MKKIKNLFNKIKIKKITKNILHFFFPSEKSRNITGIFQLLLIFGLLLVAFRFMGLHNFFDIIKNGLSFVSLLTLMILYRILTRK